jgi:hypothetical protein
MQHTRRLGAPEWIDPALLHELDGALWHATRESRWTSIVADAEIRPNANADFENGFCRSIGAISLFDLSQPDKDVPQTATHWSRWLKPIGTDTPVWIEIDRQLTTVNVISPAALLKCWREKNPYEESSTRIIAGIEAGYLGPIPLNKIIRALVLRPKGWSQIAIANLRQ